jgi:hypothetical protein
VCGEVGGGVYVHSQDVSQNLDVTSPPLSGGQHC